MDIAKPTITVGLVTNSYNTPSINLTKRRISFSSRSLRTVVEHLPSVNLRRLRFEKYIFLSFIFAVNLIIIYLSRSFSRFYWFLLPITIHRPLLDCLEILAIIILYAFRRANPRMPEVPQTLENLAYLLPCYNETYEELRNSLNSLAEQKHLNAHNKVIIIICDGRFRGRGMTKTTAEYLTENIVEHPSCTPLQDAYTSWDGTQMDVEIVQGRFRSLPVFCIIKEENRGKRDSLILVRSCLHKFNQRNLDSPLGIFSLGFFTKFCNFLIQASMPSVEYVVGMDADTRFDAECTFNLMQIAREGNQVVGVTGQILVDLTTSKPFSIAHLYQNAEYAIGQHRRRLRQNLTSHKVTCLPGCCQLLRVVESTCGDEILRQFGYHPNNKDGLFRTIRSMMSEDRDHVCLVLRENADVETRQCLSALAYTSVPQSFSVFLSQRRRWTLGPVTSDVLLATRKSTGYIERIAATSSVISWSVTLSHSLCFLFRENLDVRTGFILFMLGRFRNIWDILVVFKSSKSLTEVVQCLIGVVMCSTVGQTVTVIIHLYSLYHLDDFRWGKTRVTISDN
ncbi:glycosyltransferase family 2 protein [Dothidotthia symphoricarpi CBS 119687]|uniref:chitin synthase n=1 Tax=Dothidotthia symphoricarpi CBS 119687 TaxID=1392245 RepID=A0A6A6A573_9PLEO|nr:glycosyltransferase family 2 protein [Dothidotthia symphoricarpi CBS 119687]KAF2126323.1 glycosyltransferase family 2 protein [Dothidotthia symphoricarpi CBS 119687]